MCAAGLGHLAQPAHHAFTGLRRFSISVQPAPHLLGALTGEHLVLGRLLFNMLGAIGQFETEIRAERQMDGIKKAKKRGVQLGKRPALTENQIIELRDKRVNGVLIKDLMAEYSLS